MRSGLLITPSTIPASSSDLNSFSSITAVLAIKEKVSTRGRPCRKSSRRDGSRQEPTVTVAPMRKCSVRVQFSIVKSPDSISGHLQKFSSGFRNIKPLGQPVEQRSVIVLLQLMDSLADSRLGQIKFFCRKAHFSCFRYCNKYFQMPDGHTYASCFGFVIK